MIPPTIGRVVWYYPYAAVLQPWPALVAYVHEDGTINLGGFQADGTPFDARRVILVQDGQLKPAFDYATWMPYQIEVAAEAAAKTEASVSKLTPLNPSK